MSPEAESLRNAIAALARYPTGGLAGQVEFLGGTKKTAALLLPPKKGHTAKQPRPGIGARQVQLYLAHERFLAGEPGAPKIHKPIPKAQRKQLNTAVSEKALQLLIIEMRTNGLLATVGAWMKISNKPFYREMGPVKITHEQRDEADRSLLTLLCDAASKHLWEAAFGFFEPAFFQAYLFEEAHFDAEESGGEGIEEIALGLPSTPLDRES